MELFDPNLIADLEKSVKDKSLNQEKLLCEHGESIGSCEKCANPDEISVAIAVETEDDIDLMDVPLEFTGIETVVKKPSEPKSKPKNVEPQIIPKKEINIKPVETILDEIQAELNERINITCSNCDSSRLKLKETHHPNRTDYRTLCLNCGQKGFLTTAQAELFKEQQLTEDNQELLIRQDIGSKIYAIVYGTIYLEPLKEVIYCLLNGEDIVNCKVKGNSDFYRRFEMYKG